MCRPGLGTSAVVGLDESAVERRQQQPGSRSIAELTILPKAVSEASPASASRLKAPRPLRTRENSLAAIEWSGQLSVPQGRGRPTAGF